MSFDIRKMSIAHWFPDTEKQRCGYCNSISGRISDGMWAETLTVEDYQDLIDRGWRRSGKYCYKPIMNETCCPQYTIKCDTLNISLSKSQKKVIKKFNKYLADGILNKADFKQEEQCSEGCDNSMIVFKDCPNINFTKINNKPEELLNKDQQERSHLDLNEPHHSRINCDDMITVQTNSEDKGDPQISTSLKMPVKESTGPDSNKPPCKKAKLLRLERKKEKLMKRGLTLEKKEPLQTQKTLEQYLGDISQNSTHKLRITLERMTSDHELFTLSAKLFQKYQMSVHNEPLDECDEEQFDSFLVKTPLKPVNFPRGVDGPGYGSFHQQYWIDDRLVAVGVIDILPKCVSSVYFFYDPDYRNLTLGTYGALREVQFTRHLQRKIPELSNYYMGYYIHTCQKMRYKGKLVPSFLLCPETYHWVPIEKCIEKLDANKYSRLEDDIDAVDQNFPTTEEIGEIMVVYDYKLMYVRNYKRYRKEQNLFNQIGQLVGKKCAKSIVFCIN